MFLAKLPNALLLLAVTNVSASWENKNDDSKAMVFNNQDDKAAIVFELDSRKDCTPRIEIWVLSDTFVHGPFLEYNYDLTLRVDNNQAHIFNPVRMGVTDVAGSKNALIISTDINNAIFSDIMNGSYLRMQAVTDINNKDNKSTTIIDVHDGKQNFMTALLTCINLQESNGAR